MLYCLGASLRSRAMVEPALLAFLLLNLILILLYRCVLRVL